MLGFLMAAFVAGIVYFLLNKGELVRHYHVDEGSADEGTDKINEELPSVRAFMGLIAKIWVWIMLATLPVCFFSMESGNDAAGKGMDTGINLMFLWILGFAITLFWAIRFFRKTGNLGGSFFLLGMTIIFGFVQIVVADVTLGVISKLGH